MTPAGYSSPETENWLEGAYTSGAIALALKLGYDDDLAHEAVAVLTLRYLERIRSGALKRPLSRNAWSVELKRLLAQSAEKRRRELELPPDDDLPELAGAQALWSDELTPTHEAAEELLVSAISRYATSVQRQCHEARREAKRSGVLAPPLKGRSKSTFYEHVQKAQDCGRAGAVLLAIESSEASDTLLSPSLGSHGLLSDGVMKSLDSIVRALEEEDRERLVKASGNLWNDAADTLMRLLPRADTSTPVQLAVVPTCLFTLFAIARIAKRDVLEPWRDLWREADTTGLLRNPHSFRELAAIGAYAGDDSMFIKFLLSPDNIDMELAQMLLYVDGGVRSMTQGNKLPFKELVLGNPDHLLRRCAGKKRPFKALVDYAKTCLTNERYDNAGLSLMVLSWIERMVALGAFPRSEVHRVLSILRNRQGKLRHGVAAPTFSKLHDSLAATAEA